ncbi:MAG: hypothetical protein K2L39_03825, partial [Muribaculaceae bacterium]|nr:hypothetical protein [Muribaculaceae bacterium]
RRGARGTAPGCLSPEGEFPVRRAEPPSPRPKIFTRPWPFGSFGPAKRTETVLLKEQKRPCKKNKQKENDKAKSGARRSASRKNHTVKTGQSRK